MNHCVPEWDIFDEDLDVHMHSRVKSKWSPDQQRKPDNNFQELGQHLAAMEGQIEKFQKQRHWSVDLLSDFSAAPQCEDAVPTSRLKVSEKDGLTFETVTHDALVSHDPCVAGQCMQDIDLVSWIQNQANEPVDNCCNEFHAETPINSSTFIWNDSGTPVYSLSRNENIGSPTNERPLENTCYDSLLIFPSDNMETAASSNMTSGSNVEASSIYWRTNNSMLRSEPSLKHASSTAASSCSMNSIGRNSVNILSQGIHRSALVSSEMPPPKIRHGTLSGDGPSSHGKSSVMNFSQFSRPVAALKDRLNAFRFAIGMNQAKNLDSSAVEACVSTESSTESTVTGMSASWNLKDSNLPSGVVPKALNSYSISNKLPSTVKETGFHASGCMPVNVSRGSGSSDVQKECLFQKRKNQDAELSECQSDDPDEESGDLKRTTPAKTASAKRNRAAEIHNLSERRRRDRINEKLKALQELIPNCNKTDKASLLEEVIEYLKMLQTQLQVMTLRNGMNISPMLIPPAMQHLQMAQLASIPHWGMGMGMEMLQKVAASVPRHVVPLPSFPGLLVPGSAVLPMPGIRFSATPHLVQFPPKAAVDLEPSSVVCHEVNTIHQYLQPLNTSMLNTSEIYPAPSAFNYNAAGQP